jgi:isochorismate pyruvate lyase
MPAPEECRTKDEVRQEIDRLDRALVALLAERFAYVRRMAELKSEPAEALDPERVADVAAKVAAEAARRGLDPALVEELWRRLMDWNIAWERQAIGRGP